MNIIDMFSKISSSATKSSFASNTEITAILVVISFTILSGYIYNLIRK